MGQGGATTSSIAVKVEPTNADAQNLLGYAYRNQKKFDLAFRHYNEALRLDPKHKAAHEYVGEAYVLDRATRRRRRSTWRRSSASAARAARSTRT